jgi:hypothetical protein
MFVKAMSKIIRQASEVFQPGIEGFMMEMTTTFEIIQLL